MATDAEVVRAYIEALSAGDMDAVAERLHDDIFLHVPGRNPTSGERRGKEDVLDFLRRMSERAGGRMAVEVHDLLASDDHVVALVKRNLAGADTRAAIVYHLRDGRITGIWPHEGDQYAVDEAMGG